MFLSRFWVKARRRKEGIPLLRSARGKLIALKKRGKFRIEATKKIWLTFGF